MQTQHKSKRIKIACPRSESSNSDNDSLVQGLKIQLFGLGLFDRVRINMLTSLHWKALTIHPGRWFDLFAEGLAVPQDPWAHTYLLQNCDPNRRLHGCSLPKQCVSKSKSESQDSITGHGGFTLPT